MVILTRSIINFGNIKGLPINGIKKFSGGGGLSQKVKKIGQGEGSELCPSKGVG